MKKTDSDEEFEFIEDDMGDMPSELFCCYWFIH